MYFRWILKNGNTANRWILKDGNTAKSLRLWEGHFNRVNIMSKGRVITDEWFAGIRVLLTSKRVMTD